MADMKTSPRLSKSIGDIRSGLFARIEAVQDEYAAKGWLPARLNLNKGIARGFIELFAWGLWQLYNFLDRIKAALDNAIVINHDVKAKASAPVSVSVRAVLELLDAVIRPTRLC